jgi:hypothetical protein
MGRYGSSAHTKRDVPSDWAGWRAFGVGFDGSGLQNPQKWDILPGYFCPTGTVERQAMIMPPWVSMIRQFGCESPL